MGNFVLGLILIAFAAVMGFYGTQLARDGWAKIFQAPSAVVDGTATNPIKTGIGSMTNNKENQPVNIKGSGNIVTLRQTGGNNTIINPPVPFRTLGDRRDKLVARLRSLGNHTLVLHLATRGSKEAINYFNEIESVFKDAGWNVEKPNGILLSDIIGIQLRVKSITDVKPTQHAVAKAFADLSIPLPPGIDPSMPNEDIIEINVGLQ